MQTVNELELNPYRCIFTPQVHRVLTSGLQAATEPLGLSLQALPVGNVELWEASQPRIIVHKMPEDLGKLGDQASLCLQQALYSTSCQ
jgi:hypothetical protein